MKLGHTFLNGVYVLDTTHIGKVSNSKDIFLDI